LFFALYFLLFLSSLLSVLSSPGIYKGGKGDRELLYPCPVIA
jgi:hypothetical protein